MSLINPVTTPGIDPVTVRLVVQRLNHYTTPGPTFVIYKVKIKIKVNLEKATKAQRGSGSVALLSL